MQDGVGGIFQCAATIEGLLEGSPREHPASFHTVQSIYTTIGGSVADNSTGWNLKTHEILKTERSEAPFTHC